MNAPTVRERMLRVREQAILDVVNRLLADKGYEAMTVDAVAAEVGIAKASLYKHFASKEVLAAAAMVRALQRAQSFLAELSLKPDITALERLRSVVSWTLGMQYDGAMPSLPSESSSLRSVLAADKAYVTALMEVSETLGGWIAQAQAEGELDPTLPAEVVLFSIYARACDAVLPVLKSTGQHGRDQIIAWLVRTCFDGLIGPRPAGGAKP